MFRSFLSEKVIPGRAKWDEGKPMENLSGEEFKSLLKVFKLASSIFKKEYFASFQARVYDEREILFPVYYRDGNHLMGIRRLFICPHTNQMREETLSAGSKRIFCY